MRENIGLRGNIFVRISGAAKQIIDADLLVSLVSLIWKLHSYSFQQKQNIFNRKNLRNAA